MGSCLRNTGIAGARRALAAAAVALLGPACGGSGGLHGASATPPAGNEGVAGAAGAPAGRPAGAPVAVSESEALRPRDDLPAAERALVFVSGPDGKKSERWVDARAIESAGYTVVDLRDDWAPFIFQEQDTPEGQPLPNRYRRIFLGLANDQLDSDGEPLVPGDKNFLELYGIPPALSVLRARFIQDTEHPCHDQESVDALEAVETVTYVAPEEMRKDEKRLAKIRTELETARHKAKLASLDDLAAQQPALAPKVKLLAKRAAEKPAMAAVERRLTCEGFLGGKHKHANGVYDDAMRLAVRRFQQKHMIYESNYLRKKTVDALAKPLVENDYDGLVRALRERVVSAAAIVEDGTTSTQKNPVRNLTEEYTNAALEQMDLKTPETALEFFKRHPAEDFRTLRVAVKLAARPDYYSDNMDLSIVIDRGDVWYDLPIDEEGHWKQQPRKHYPQLTVYVKHNGKQIPLAHWRTTIGGWRAEQASDGYEYYRYKMSDVGPRVIRQVNSGPVWIAPAYTPIRSLIKGKVINQSWMRVVNYDELGPGYLSAYGLIVGYLVVPGQNGRADWDNGVRVHGSSDYLSIYSANGFSHGCHRLPNHLAIRMYSFILRHRNMHVSGDSPMGFTRQFLSGESVFEMRIPSRGYIYTLDPPLPVNVLEGNIMGDLKKPILDYVPEPWNKYPPGPPPPAPQNGDKAGGGSCCGE
jgi:murein DD-endopeptidase MepM/ murein hydrolase activator NlpD